MVGVRVNTPADLVEAGLTGSQFIGSLSLTVAFVAFVSLGVAWMRRAAAQV